MKKYVIIVAGGSGSRMGSDIPKQFLSLSGKPILLHTVERFLQVPDIQVIIVLPSKDIDYWYQITESNQIIHTFNSSIIITEGGVSRFQSVKNGLHHIKEAGLVAVHDGVRPLVSLEIILNSFEIASLQGSAITSVMLKDSVREVSESGENRGVDRTKFRLMQTPQTFRTDVIKKAFQVEEQSFFTDCASVAEFAGYKITLIDGSYKNIKITTPEDLLIAEALINS